MLALAGWPMGFEFSFLADPRESTRCISGLGNTVTFANGMSAEEIYKALGQPDVITIEREAVDVPLLKELKAFCPVYPDPDIAWTIQNRHREKSLVHELGLATSPWSRIQGEESLPDAIEAIGGLPVVIKSTEDGYDGHNQWVLDTPDQIAAFESDRKLILKGESKHKHSLLEWIVEKKISFEREISVIGARNVDGDITSYIPGENVHQNGILHTTIVPAPKLSETIRAKAENYISTLLEQTGYAGVLAVECFVVGDDLLINELAPRVHNSGHWTMDGADTSQFENHVRAIANLPLGSTQQYGVAGMHNLLGKTLSDDTTPPTALVKPKQFLHWYGKTSRPGRKIGHVNVLASSQEELAEKLESVRKQWFDA
ncbi:5-(carboxyamino)imidazole ribonucleotide synthase [Sansalvadorimonas sp. 2012CJ34-2]|uniref:N5-carboxyaminoimidazole ribonucleotide synthase n=2 Tax=Parendozoicomonas callyspongiae TaxID=2942213 RepID=A0ABT0PHI0_9GAMM|nr:5-(carboxyamino)imidazole ribonucleotide synthase [Sansalvadorimonas sp. 2012CJ34-2]MCL6270837.1 5-(carboxyamino)imidazole ribonucleotide synthase [Sansalvadorimonas sp. 2012CJ34-2]